MRKICLVAGAVVAAAGSAPAAEVDIFGIHTPSLGRWAVYARVTGVDSPSTLASISIDVVKTTSGAGTATPTSSTLALPFGQTPYTDSSKFGSTNPEVGYGFWFLRNSGTVSPDDGIYGIAASQWTTYDASDTVPYRDLILPSVGIAPGSALKNDTTGGNFKTSAGFWGSPVLVASGSYTPAGTTAAATAVGPTLKFTNPAASANVLRWVPANSDYTVELNPVLAVLDPRTNTPYPSEQTPTTVRAGLGDANLDDVVNFDDLLLLAKSYNGLDRTWFNGDFTFDGLVNFDDLLVLAKNYNKVYSQAVPSSPAFTAEFNADIASAFAAAVPEPGALGILGIAAGALGLRRRRSV
jgi:hypothetical protein